jgi:hypothetical protein
MGRLSGSDWMHKLDFSEVTVRIPDSLLRVTYAEKTHTLQQVALVAWLYLDAKREYNQIQGDDLQEHTRRQAREERSRL